MKFIRFSLLFFCFLNPLFQTKAQIKNIGLPEIKNYKRSDYRGGTQNWGMDQDKDGTIYFANNAGLFQFDGSSWNSYKLPNNSSIRSLKIGNGGKIYVGGYNEFGYFKANEKGRLIYQSISKLVNENNIKLIDFTWKIHVLKEEVVFQSFGRAYIYKNNKLRVLEAPNRFQFSFLVDGTLYFQDVSTGILEYKNGKLIQLKGTDILNTTEVWGILPLPEDKLLIATLDKGLYLYDENGIAPWETEANAYVKKNSSLGGSIIKKKFIVLNSVLDGVIICDTNGKIVQHINRKKGLQNNTVLASFVDSNDNLWLGLDNGIAFINENSPFTYFGFSYELSTVYASAVYNGKLYVATNQGLFYHSWNKSFKDDSFKLVEGTTGQTWNIQVVDNQLICSHNRGVMIISDDKVQKVLDTRGYWGLKKIPNQPHHAIACNYNGFAFFEKTGNGWEFKNQIEGVNISASTFEIENNNVWLKKDDQLYQMKLSADRSRFTSIRAYKNLSKNLKGITSIQRLDNRLYFQTQNQFFKFSYEEDLFVQDRKMTDLFKSIPKVNSMNQDSQKNIWYAFGESLGVLSLNSSGEYRNNVVPFSNLTGNLVQNYASINTVDQNNILIGLTDGLAHYDSQLLKNFSSKPKAFIRSFTFPGDTLVIGNIANYNLTIPFKGNNVKFTFSSPTYENLENMEFSYKLEGFEEKWSNWTTVPMKEYTNLHEGDYEMKVKARNSYGIQSEPAIFKFTVSPPFYRHFLAYVLYVIVIGLSIYLVRKRIKMKIRKNKYYETIEQRRLYLEKESKIRQEQYDLEKEIERLKNEKLKIKILAKDKELVNNSLQVVKKNKILNGIIHKLKDIDSEALDEAAKSQFTKLNRSIVKEVNADKSWKDLEKHIKNVHFDFLKRLKEKYPTISPRELDLSTYLLMNMSTKEIAEIMNISSGGVELARYRLRKKLGLNKKENLIGFLMSI